MYRIGEFSKIGQVSGRQLRHYDQLGLLVPEHIDRFTGYRYYSAHQLPRLNRILALKELGLSLEQIKRLLDEEVSQQELRGMLTMRKSQIEQLLEDEIARLRYIETRINQIDIEGEMHNYEIVLKSVPAQKFIAVREVCPELSHGRELLYEMQHILPARIGSKAFGHFVAVVYSDMFELVDIDLEVGVVLEENIPEDTIIPLADGNVMTVRELPAVETMMTAVRLGETIFGTGTYAALGMWAEANGYQIAGDGREVFIQLAQIGKEHEAVTEIQFPVKKVDLPLLR